VRLSDVLEGFSYGLDGVMLNGVDYQRFRPFTTIKNRVQIGLIYGGAARMTGNISSTPGVQRRAVFVHETMKE